VTLAPQRVLTIRLGAVGDVLTTLPAIAALRRLLPNAVIHHLVERGAAPVVQGLPALNDVIVVPRDEITRELKRFRLKTFASTWSRLRSERYDLVIDFQNLLRSAVWKVATGARHGIVRNHWRELSPLPFDMRVACDAKANVVVQHGQLLSALTQDGRTPTLKPCAPAIGAAASIEARGVMSDERYIVIAPGSRWPRRAVPDRLIEAAVKAITLPVVLLGGPNERGWLEGLAKRLNIPVSVDLKLEAMFALIKQASGLVCADSAPLHAADMFGVPMTCIFGPSAPELYGPAFAQAAVLRDAQYAGQHSFRGKNIDYFAGIDAASVERAVGQMLDAAGGA
jgi:heptosyltransferase-1